jgi:hypothetical protein
MPLLSFTLTPIFFSPMSLNDAVKEFLVVVSEKSVPLNAQRYDCMTPPTSVAERVMVTGVAFSTEFGSDIAMIRGWLVLMTSVTLSASEYCPS